MDELTELLPPVPAGRELPDHAAHRAGLLAVIGAQTPARGIGWPAPRRRWLIPAGAAAAMLVIAGAVALVRLPGPAGPAPGERPGANQVPPPGNIPATGTVTLTGPTRWGEPAAIVRQVVINSAAGAVTVTAGAGNAQIGAVPAAASSPPTVSVAIYGPVLTITVRCPPPGGSRCGARLTVVLPPRVSVTATAQLGNVSVTGFSGPVHVTAELGDIRLQRDSGPVRADAELGDIDGAGLGAGNAWLTAQLGAINVAFATAPALITATDEQGPVTVRVPAGLGYRVTAQAELGATAISVPRADGAAHVIRASSQLGSVTITDR